MKIESATALLEKEGLDFHVKETVSEKSDENLSEEKIVIRVKEKDGKVELTYCKV